MKKFVNAALALLLMAGVAQAQKVQPGKMQRSHAMEQLNLTADQKAKIEALRASHKQEWAQWKQQNAGNDAAVKTRKKELMQKHRAQVSEVLTPEQRQQMQQLRAQRGNKPEARMQGQARKGLQELGLSASQQQKMKLLQQDFRTKRKSLHSNAALTPAQKETEIKALAQQRRQEMKAILTPEQQQKLENRRKEIRARNAK